MFGVRVTVGVWCWSLVLELMLVFGVRVVVGVWC